MASLGSIFVDLIADTSKFESGMARASRSVSAGTSSWQRQLKQTSKQFDALGISISQIAGSLAAAFSVGALIGNLRGVATEMDNIGKASDRLGIATDSLSKMAFAGGLADVSLEAIERSVKKMQSSLVAAAEASNRAGDAFSKIGLDAKQLIGLRTEDAFAKITAALIAIENPTIRNARAVEIFGKAALGLINYAGQGSKSLQELYQEAQRLGVVFDREAAAKAERFNDSLRRVNESFKGLMVSFVASGGLDSLAARREAVARNMDSIGKTAEVLAAVLIGRLVASIAATGVAFLAATSEAIAYQAALARMAGVSVAAATGIGALSAAAGGLRAVLAVFGGPVGFAVTAALTAWALHTNKATEAQIQYNQSVGDFQSKAQEMATASGARRKQLEADTNAIIEAHIRELESLNQLIERYVEFGQGNFAQKALGSLALAGEEVAGKLGIGKAPSEILAQSDALAKTIQKMRTLLKDPTGGVKLNFGTEGSGALKANDDLKKSMADAARVYDSTRTALEKYKIEVANLDELLGKGLISQDTYSRAIENLNDTLSDSDEQLKKNKQAAKDLGLTFSSAFEDAIVGGKKFSDILGGIASDIYRMFVRSSITEPLANFFSGGEGGGFFSKLFGGGTGGIDSGLSNLFSKFSGLFADGGNIGPGQWGITGENGPEIAAGGSSGLNVFPMNKVNPWNQGNNGNTYVFSAPGADQAELRRLEQIVASQLGPGKIEHRIAAAQARGMA